MLVRAAYATAQRLRSLYRLWFLRRVYGRQIRIGRSVGVRRAFIVNISTPEATLTIGDNCSFNNFCSINVRRSVTIGNDCIIGEGVRFYDHDHLFTEDAEIRRQGFACDPIAIGNNCWFGSNVTILRGVSVGANSVVGAGAIITKSIPPNSVVVAKQNLTVRESHRGQT